MLGWSTTVKAWKFAILAALPTLIAFGNAAVAQQQDAQRDAAFAKIAAGAEFCRKNLQSAPRDVKLGEVDAFCRCMGIHEAAFDMGGVKEEDRPAMRPALQQMCVGMIRQQLTREANQAPVLPSGPAAPQLPEVAAPTLPQSAITVVPRTVGPQAIDERAAAFMNACVANPTLMKGESDAVKASACKCIVDRMPPAGQAIKSEDVSKARDVCIALARPMPVRFGAWKMQRGDDGKPRAISSFKTDQGVDQKKLNEIIAFCHDRQITYQIRGDLAGRRVMRRETGGGDDPRPAYLFRFDNSGIFDKDSSNRMTADLLAGERKLRNENNILRSNNPRGYIISDDISYGIEDINPKHVRLGNGQTGILDGLSRFESRGVIEMIGYMRAACGA
jgi:hypothetical protein